MKKFTKAQTDDDETNNGHSILNKANLRKKILEIAEEVRPGWARHYGPLRVSTCNYPYLERKMIELIQARMHGHPTKGKTIHLEK